MATTSVSILIVSGGRLSCVGRPCAAASVESTIRNAAMMKSDFMAASLCYRFCTRIKESGLYYEASTEIRNGDLSFPPRSGGSSNDNGNCQRQGERTKWQVS